jgi:hypothetical protein
LNRKGSRSIVVVRATWILGVLVGFVIAAIPLAFVLLSLPSIGLLLLPLVAGSLLVVVRRASAQAHPQPSSVG